MDMTKTTVNKYTVQQKAAIANDLRETGLTCNEVGRVMFTQYGIRSQKTKKALSGNAIPNLIKRHLSATVAAPKAPTTATVTTPVTTTTTRPKKPQVPEYILTVITDPWLTADKKVRLIAEYCN